MARLSHRAMTPVVVVATLVAAPVLAAGPARADSPVFRAMNTSETPPDGVWFRNSPHTGDTDRVTGHGVYANESVQLSCYAFGDAVGPYTDSLWYYVKNVARPTHDGVTNVGYLNAHYIDDGANANQVDAGVPACNATPQSPVPPAPIATRQPVAQPPVATSNRLVTDLTNPHWAGYEADASNVRMVDSTWTVPTVDCGSYRAYSSLSMWAGIDNGQNDLVQAGIKVHCDSTAAQPRYEYWWESLPNGENIVGNVSANDVIHLVIAAVPSTHQWVMILSVDGRLTFQKTIFHKDAADNTAECIIEAPGTYIANSSSHGAKRKVRMTKTLTSKAHRHRKGANYVYGIYRLSPLAEFGVAQFSSCSVGYADGTSRQVGLGVTAGSASSTIRYTMADMGRLKASVSPTSPDGSSWTTVWSSH
jgi:hypothetical protein